MVGLEWVQVDGAIRHVSEFAKLPPARRPACACPECGGPVTLKLGQINMHHAAHRPGSSCSLIAGYGGEGILHANVKYRLYDELRRLRRLIMSVACSICGALTSVCIVEAYTSVQIEKQLVTGWRPDLSLYLDDQCVAGLEIVDSHQPSAEAREAAISIGVPLVAVQATHKLQAWRDKSPLPLYFTVPGPAHGYKHKRCQYAPLVTCELLDWNNKRLVERLTNVIFGRR